jgi:2-methylisocitrate lyase-like PEP mutase family enzyme
MTEMIRSSRSLLRRAINRPTSVVPSADAPTPNSRARQKEIPLSPYLSKPVDGPRQLRELLSAGQPVLAPGVYDAIGARLVEEAGFGAVYMTGFGTVASRLGRPDVGLLTMTEMVDNARVIARAVQLPVIADADTGYGNAINVVRTVQEFEQAGVAAIHLEDQVAPKRCGHLEGKQIVQLGEMLSKIRAAVAARTVPELVLIARTDAAAVEGIDSAIDRARYYRDAGADVLFVEATTSEAEIERVASKLSDMPLLFNWVEGGKTPPIPYGRLRELGFAFVIFPLTTLLTAMASIRRALAQIKEVGTPTELLEELPSFSALTEFTGLGEIRELERQFTN